MTPRQQIETNGYYVAPGLLSQAETARLRATLMDHFPNGGRLERLGRHQPGAAAALPGLSWLFSRRGILDTFRALLGAGDLVFCGHCDTHLNMLSLWHRDTSEELGGCFSGDYISRPTCRVYRAGIYLQDHGDDQGFKARRGSHRQAVANGCPVDRVRTREGDVTFHDVRLVHAGALPDPFESVLLGAGKHLGWPAWITATKNTWWRVTGKPNKLSIFFAVGTVDADTEDFCRFELQARLRQLGPDGLRLPGPLLEALAAAGVLSYEAALEQQFGPSVMDDFAQHGSLPADKLWA